MVTANDKKTETLSRFPLSECKTSCSLIMITVTFIINSIFLEIKGYVKFFVQHTVRLLTVHTQDYGLTWENKHHVMVILCSLPSYTQDNHMHRPPPETQNMGVLPGLSAPGLIAAHFI